MKKTYEKPVLLINTGLFEGVYMASGAAAGTAGYTAEPSGNGWGNTTVYKFSFPSGAAEGWQITVSFTGAVNSANTYGSYATSVSGNTVTISSGQSWNATLSEGASFEVQIEGVSGQVFVI